MKTFKYVTTLILIFIGTTGFGQYSETFSNPNKGLLSGTNTSGSSTGACPANTLQDCTNNDFVGETWTINGNFTGFDANDIMATNGSGVLFIDGDIDNELCFESPVLSIEGTISLSADVGWIDHDDAEYVRVDYMIDGGAWTSVPNQYGGGSKGAVDFGGSGNTGSGTVALGGLAGTSTFSIRVCADSNTASNGEAHTLDNVIVTGASILPVKWAGFKVQSLKEGNQLDWATYTEVNNERFDIEKSVDGMNDFRKIGSIDGVGNSTRISRYEFLDREISNGTSYYRIKQVDFDEKFEYSEVVLVKNEMETEISIYPNPADDFIIVNSVSGTDIDQPFQVYDAMGRLISLETNKENDYTVRLNTSSLESGIYFIKLSSGNMRKVIKL